MKIILFLLLAAGLVRATYAFEGVQAAPSVFRLHDTDFKVP
jgi:hypothetical protein